MNSLFLGVLAALGAGLLWGCMFVIPLLLPNYPPAYLTFGRYFAFGLVTLPIAWWQREQLRLLMRQDWLTAAGLSLVGNFAYYFAVCGSIQMAGAPLPTLLIGTLPIVIAVTSQWQQRQQSAIQWRALAPSLMMIAAGLLCVNAEQIERLASRSDKGATADYALGGAIACLAVAAWTWYPLRNSAWLKKHPGVSGATWASAQGLVTLPMALVGWTLSALWFNHSMGEAAPALLGPQPLLFVGLMLFAGLGASWLGTLLWNIASQRTPPSLTGQLIVFETLAALCYAYALYARLPSALELAGITCLVIGVILGVRQLR